MIQDFDEVICNDFDNTQYRSERKMIMEIIIKVRELIAEVNYIKKAVITLSERTEVNIE